MTSGGTQFELSVADVLRASGFHTEHNVDLDGQQVDNFAQKRFMGSTQRIAVECKDYSKALGLDEVSLVYAKYHALIESSQVDRVLLVTRLGLTPKASAYVHRLRREFHHQTLEQLIDSVMEFEDYVQGLINSFVSSEEAACFIPPRIHSGFESECTIDLASEVLEWCRGDVGHPMALVSGYGMGKSTFLRFVAAKVGKLWMNDRSQRIPVLIDLSTIADEQSLEGLIAKALTVDEHVHNYSFPYFMKMNELGRLVILLDAFDEMKHGISWGAFFHNMREIRRLYCPRSRLLIAGRPTIFASEEEMRELLDGVGAGAVVSGAPAGFPGFRELHLEPWTEHEIEEFLVRYTQIQVAAKRLPADALVRIKSRIREDESRRILDLAKRPIQLKMIAVVLPEWKERIDCLSEAIIYSEFIDVLLKREVAKLNRAGIGAKVRRRFAKELAWMLWHGEGKKAVRFHDLSDEMVERVIGRSPMIREDVLRELVVGSLVEYKQPDILFFPHRSLQEYLVAEYAADAVHDGKLDFEQFKQLLNTFELGRFIAQMVGPNDLRRFMPKLLASRGKLPETLEVLYFHMMEEFRNLLRAKVHSPWPAIFCLKYGGWSYPPATQLIRKRAHGHGRRKIKVLPEEQMEASDLGCMIASRNAVGMACALHKILLSHFPRFEDLSRGLSEDRSATSEVKAEEVIYNKAILKEFLRMVQLLPRLKCWGTLPRESKEALSEILNGIAIHEKSRSLQLGSARKALARIYSNGASLKGVVHGGGIAPWLDIASSIIVADPKELESWHETREKILAM